MPVIKYRVHEVAKDFNIKSNSIIEMLGKYFGDTKKHQTALENAELDIIFDTLTQDNQVESFDSYFAMEKPASAEKPEEKTGDEAQPQPETTDAQPAAEAKPAKTQADKGKNQTGKGAEKAADGKPFAKNADKKKKQDSPYIQSRTKGEAKTVDTRSSFVELDKYNEKYEEIAPERGKRSDRETSKQKIKQKSQQYRKQQGMRQRKRETEAERLQRIAAARAKQQITVIIGD